MPALVLLTVSVYVWTASVPTPLWAVTVKLQAPALPEAGVPASVAVPPPLSVNVTPPGNAPLSVRLGSGEPVAVIVKVPTWPSVKADGLPVVAMAGGCPTTTAYAWVPVNPWTSVTVRVKAYDPGVVGVPPRPLAASVRPVGRAPDASVNW